MTRVPIACTLTADEIPDRLAQWAAVRANATVASIPGGRRLVLTDVDRQTLEALVDAERGCCGFLTLTLAEGGTEGELILDITGPAEADPVIEALAGGATGAA